MGKRLKLYTVGKSRLIRTWVKLRKMLRFIRTTLLGIFYSNSILKKWKKEEVFPTNRTIKTAATHRPQKIKIILKKPKHNNPTPTSQKYIYQGSIFFLFYYINTFVSLTLRIGQLIICFSIAQRVWENYMQLQMLTLRWG
jgi:hypothetical protein